jgi:hypothetical protein
MHIAKIRKQFSVCASAATCAGVSITFMPA